jgi:hypothetical protein
MGSQNDSLYSCSIHAHCSGRDLFLFMAFLSIFFNNILYHNDNVCVCVSSANNSNKHPFDELLEARCCGNNIGVLVEKKRNDMQANTSTKCMH